MAETAAKQAKSQEKTVPVRTGARRSQLPEIFERDLLEDLLDDFGRGMFRLPKLLRRRASSLLHDMPRLASIDVYETDDEVIVEAELPGIAKEDIEVTVNGSMLTLKGEKKQASEVKEDSYHRSERSFGMVSRTVELPADVRSDRTVAKMTDGVLKIHLPKTDEAKRKAVKVKVE